MNKPISSGLDGCFSRKHHSLGAAVYSLFVGRSGRMAAELPRRISRANDSGKHSKCQITSNKPMQTQIEIDTMQAGGAANRLALILVFATSLLWAFPGIAAEKDAALWAALRSGQHIALLRHAIAPGTGDPPQFSLGDCSTQRNLSNKGRNQAARIGARLRSNGITVARIFASQWCRCLETAILLEIGPVNELPMLNSFFQRVERANSQNQALNKWLAGQNLDNPLLLVTHQVNITALSGVYPASGELVVMRRSEDGQLSTVGTIRTD